MNRLLLIILAVIIPIQAYSKKGPFFLSSKSGNVETLIIIDDTISAEIRKIKKIGELCNSYLLNSEFNDVPVFIWYLHTSNLDKNKDSIYLSFDKGKSKFYLFDRRQYRRSQLLENEGIVIRITGSNIDSKLILELLEYGLHNKDYIKKNQKKASFTYWKHSSLHGEIFHDQPPGARARHPTRHSAGAAVGSCGSIQHDDCAQRRPRDGCGDLEGARDPARVLESA